MANEVRTAKQNALAMNCIDYVHDEVHRGKLWVVSTYSKNIASTSTINMLIITSSKEVHMKPVLESTGPLYVRFYEGTVQGTTSGQLTPVNMNRNFNTSAQTKWVKANSALRS